MVSHANDALSAAPKPLGPDDPERIATALELAALTLDYERRPFSKEELFQETRAYLTDECDSTADAFEAVLRGMPQLLLPRDNGLFSLRPVS